MEKVINGEAETVEVKLTAAQKAERKLVADTFKGQLTQKGLADLRAKYPADLVIDMTDDANFKAARKTRTECNKLVESISDRRKNINKDIKAYGDDLETQVTDIYSVVIDPFLAEDKRRKDIEIEKQRKHDEMIKKQRETLKGITDFVQMAKDTDDTDEISSYIDAVGNIDAADTFHKDIIHEAMKEIDSVKQELTDILLQKLEANRLKEVAEAAKKAKDEADELARKSELEKKIAERLSKLQMIPLDLMSASASASTIQKKLTALEKFIVPKEEFGERHSEAVTAKDSVIANLKRMLEQALIFESYSQEQVQEPVIIPDPEIHNVSENNQEQTQSYSVTKSPQRPDEVLETIGRASDLIPDNQVKTSQLDLDLNRWSNDFSIDANAYQELINILNAHEIQL